ncbi:recombinase family protein [Anaerovorax odorimutans]|uniref:Recombinase family protein n=1 Tax=Anaerovorax odorimutans TaxID=109327 RepID=A0ABT1RQZ4_9FIRM|nr:recombinase family protein [Anaerovorax odorimutans]MCQ4637618.1 recombinase family protein [Anaerovorax odorimutans]
MGTRLTKEGKNRNGVYFRSQGMPIVWNIGVYIRLSVADGNDVSLSVKNQDAIIKNFLENEFNEPYRLYKTYIDDGVSGTTNDERNSFQQMIRDIEGGKVNCVVSKMLSRVFRNYSDQGYFLEEYFPRMGIRFITLEAPKVDTYMNPNVVHGYELPLNGIVNDRIAESASMSVRQTFRNMRREGKFQGGFPPYGYIRNPEDKYSFVIDEEAAGIVRQIFHWYVFCRMNLEEIRRTLNERNIPNPTGYKVSKGCNYQNPGVQGNESFAWSARTIKMILQNRTYLGEMIQGKLTVISYKVHKQIQVPEDQWASVANRHEPIIEQEVFDKAQELLELNKSMKSYQSEPSLLSGFLYCADCRRKMHKRKNGKRVYYACSTYYKRNKNDCTSHFTKADIIEKAVLEAVQLQISFADVDEVLEGITELDEMEYRKEQKNQLKTVKAKIKKLDKQLEALYLDYNKRMLTEKEYLGFRKKFCTQKEALEKSLAQMDANLNDEKQRQAKRDQWKEVFRKHKNITELNRQILEELVDRIYVDEEKNITIQFKFGDLFKAYI